MNLAAFVVQLLITSQVHRFMGIGVALAVLPVAMAGGTAAVLLAGAFAPAFLLSAALSLKVAENGIRYSIDQSTRELLFLPVPSATRRRAKATIDVFIQRFGKGVAAFLLLPVFLGWMPAIQAGWLSFILIAVWLVVTGRMRDEYVRSFRDGLRAVTVDPRVPVDVSDATSLLVLVQSLDSDDANQVLRSLDLIDHHEKGELVPLLLLSHPDARVRRRALQVAVWAGRPDVVGRIEPCLASPTTTSMCAWKRCGRSPGCAAVTPLQ